MTKKGKRKYKKNYGFINSENLTSKHKNLEIKQESKLSMKLFKKILLQN